LVLLFTFAIALCLFSACHTHEFGEWTVTTEPTCTTAGLQERVCKCGKIDSKTIPTTNHEFGEWIVTKQATCTEEGVQERICKCGEIDSKTIPTTNHEFGEWTVTKEPTCTTDGLLERVCECGEIDSKTIPATNHALGEWIVNSNPDCEHAGSRQRFCKCGQESEYEKLEALGHDFVQYPEKPATCTESGWYAYEACSRCKISSYKEILPTHKLNGTICEVCGVNYVSAGLQYMPNADGQSYTVVGIAGDDAQIVVPATYNNKPVVAIGERAFYDCRYTTYVYLPDSITSIGDRAFTGCDKLKSIIIPQGVTTIGVHAFESCRELESITIPKDVTSIGDYAFFNCKKLTTVTFAGNQVKSIGDSAFAYCDSLENVVLPNGLESVALNAFSQCFMLKTISIPASVTTIGPSAFAGNTALTDIVVDANNANYKSIDGNLYSKDGTVLICYSAGKTATSFDIPQSVTTIAERAFASSQLKNITVGGNVTKVEGYVFAACESLTSVIFTAPLETLETSVFHNCQNLESVTLPSSLKTIGDYTFYNCNKLKSVNYCGTEEQWNLIEKTEYWDYTIAKYALNYNYTEK
ncbi:MAG: leucine-rich repeat domain-containing protein, partial [Clostridia bacterium]|nr:leucine-rich repeat domain-containing protein [Clostridia bacterium]